MSSLLQTWFYCQPHYSLVQDFVSREASQERLHDIVGNACIETFTYFQQPDFLKTESLILYLQRGHSSGDCVCVCARAYMGNSAHVLTRMCQGRGNRAGVCFLIRLEFLAPPIFLFSDILHVSNSWAFLRFHGTKLAYFFSPVSTYIFSLLWFKSGIVPQFVFVSFVFSCFSGILEESKDKMVCWIWPV